MRSIAKGWPLLLLVPLIACAAENRANFKLLHVADLAKLLDAKAPNLYVFDANDPEERAQLGVIPGARLLSSFNKYDVAKELPSDKGAKLVFYCANTR